MKRIEPCPFCGSECEIREWYCGDSNTPVFTVECNDVGHSLDWWSDTKEQAIDVWNHRCPLPDVEEKKEDIKDLLLRLRKSYLFNVNSDGEPNASISDLITLWDEVNKYISK